MRLYVSKFLTQHRVEDGTMTREQFEDHLSRKFSGGDEIFDEVFYAAPGEFRLDLIEEPSAWFRFRQSLAAWIAP